jgi:hypothetical protein
MIRAALLHLGVGFLFGGLLLWNKGLPFDGAVWRLLPVHVEMLFFGWMLQLAMGVAFWIAPRFSVAPRYGRVRLAYAAFVLTNAGVVVGSAGQWFAQSVWQLGGRVLLLTAASCFIVHIAPRIKPLSLPKVSQGGTQF